jgi:hypothetical protein
MTTFLTRDAIFAVSDIQTEDVFVPEWNGTVKVRGLTAAERDVYETSIVSQRGKNVELNRQNIRAKLVALSVVDEAGVRIFADTDVRKIGEKSAAAVDLLYGVASRLSGLSKDDEDELAKNSESGQNDDSPSA